MQSRTQLEDAERLTMLRERLRRSLSDPRPDLSSDEVQQHLARLHAETTKGYPGIVG